MDRLGDFVPIVREYLPLLATAGLIAVALGATHALARLREHRRGAGPAARQVAMLAVTAVGVVFAVLALPLADALKGQLLGLLGLALTAVIAFSSTTFVANAMAGLMLRAVANFRPGDWVRVGDQFGRVTERGIFHTEIQTEDHDLATLPNLYLVTNPVKVVADSGTLVTATLSLGYDRDHTEVEALLVEAAGASGLDEPFVHIVELRDSAVQYRVAGFLSEVKHLLSVRSRLQGCVLDTLHRAGVEIVSPTFMNQRALARDERFVPAARPHAAAQPEPPTPEERIFDKAEEKASQEELRVERQALQDEVESLERARHAATDDGRARFDADLRRTRARIEAITALLDGEEEPRA